MVISEIDIQSLVLPKHLDDKVARLHLGRILATLKVLSSKQASYLRVDVNGLYNPDSYCYYLLARKNI